MDARRRRFGHVEGADSVGREDQVPVDQGCLDALVAKVLLEFDVAHAGAEAFDGITVAEDHAGDGLEESGYVRGAGYDALGGAFGEMAAFAFGASPLRADAMQGTAGEDKSIRCALAGPAGQDGQQGFGNADPPLGRDAAAADVNEPGSPRTRDRLR